MKEKIINMIINIAKEITGGGEFDASSKLYDIESHIDSMDLVSIIVAIEQGVQDEYNKKITIADSKALSQKNSPFATVESLAEYVVKLLEEVNNG